MSTDWDYVGADGEIDIPKMLARFHLDEIALRAFWEQYRDRSRPEGVRLSPNAAVGAAVEAVLTELSRE